MMIEDAHICPLPQAVLDKRVKKKKKKKKNFCFIGHYTNGSHVGGSRFSQEKGFQTISLENKGNI